jgi:hypothetical protein
MDDFLIIEMLEDEYKAASVKLGLLLVEKV